MPLETPAHGCAGLRRSGRLIAACLIACLALALPRTAAMAQDEVPDETPDRAPWSVLLITVDCLRPDHMSLYGYERDTTPHLDAFAEEAMVFGNVFATSAWTSPGIASLLTGYYPPVHAQNGRFSFYDKEMSSALRVFAAAGYDVLGKNIHGPSLQDLGFQRPIKGNAAKGLAELENFVEGRADDPDPFFAWVHIKEPHLPFAPSEKNANRWIDTSRSSPGIDAVRDYWVIFRPEVDVPYRHPGKVAFTDEDIPVIRALYDGDVADADERLGKLIERMRDNGLLERTIVVISADHGEELFEHGWIGHASTSYDGKLYDELIRIPLLIRLPDASKRGRFDALAQGTDLMPTLFDILGFDAGQLDPAMQGHSLMPVVDGEAQEVRDYVFAETTIKGWTTPKGEMGRRVVAVRSRNQKLMRVPVGERGEEGEGFRVEGYDLRDDPGEQSDIYASRRAEFAELERALDDWFAENRRLSAALVLGAAERQSDNLATALREADLLGATRAFEAIQVMEGTWGLNSDPFFEHAPYDGRWSDVRRGAARLMARALDCDARGGRLLADTNGGSRDTTAWACEEE